MKFGPPPRGGFVDRRIIAWRRRKVEKSGDANTPLETLFHWLTDHSPSISIEYAVARMVGELDWNAQAE